uniref:Uncharacterized protein LOC8288069 isoform X4 n=1 Tax=Rhizophora mucronata TaxID=61149 RepID=A0A2P2K4P1_RHIMU
MASRDQALSLLTAANNHADLAVKLSSLKQAKDILLSVETSVAAELFPYLVELQYSPESLVRKMLLELVQTLISMPLLFYSRSLESLSLLAGYCFII